MERKAKREKEDNKRRRYGGSVGKKRRETVANTGKREMG